MSTGHGPPLSASMGPTFVDYTDIQNNCFYAPRTPSMEEIAQNNRAVMANRRGPGGGAAASLSTFEIRKDESIPQFVTRAAIEASNALPIGTEFAPDVRFKAGVGAVARPMLNTQRKERVNQALAKWGPLSYHEPEAVSRHAKITAMILEQREGFCQLNRTVSYPTHVTDEAREYFPPQFGSEWEVFDSAQHLDFDALQEMKRREAIQALQKSQQATSTVEVNQLELMDKGGAGFEQGGHMAVVSIPSSDPKAAKGAMTELRLSPQRAEAELTSRIALIRKEENQRRLDKKNRFSKYWFADPVAAPGGKDGEDAADGGAPATTKDAPNFDEMEDPEKDAAIADVIRRVDNSGVPVLSLADQAAVAKNLMSHQQDPVFDKHGHLILDPVRNDKVRQEINAITTAASRQRFEIAKAPTNATYATQVQEGRFGGGYDLPISPKRRNMLLLGGPAAVAHMPSLPMQSGTAAMDFGDLQDDEVAPESIDVTKDPLKNFRFDEEFGFSFVGSMTSADSSLRRGMSNLSMSVRSQSPQRNGGGHHRSVDPRAAQLQRLQEQALQKHTDVDPIVVYGPEVKKTSTTEKTGTDRMKTWKKMRERTTAAAKLAEKEAQDIKNAEGPKLFSAETALDRIGASIRHQAGYTHMPALLPFFHSGTKLFDRTVAVDKSMSMTVDRLEHLAGSQSPDRDDSYSP